MEGMPIEAVEPDWLVKVLFTAEEFIQIFLVELPQWLPFLQIA